jgi:UDP-N-acetylglucosamine--N-acetylmuramyl-(pentapeptide) pyrophosphoryl-undecaprenol N-acetylglucosamine transferase
MQGHKMIIAGGGTGGHIFPALAIARALERKEPGIQLLFVGAKGKMEMEKVPQAGYNIKGLDIAGFDRSRWWKNIMLPFKVMNSLKQAKNIIKAFQPDVVVGVGGYSSYPVLRSAQRLNIPTLIQEQNSFAGKANKLLGKHADKVCVAYDNMDRFFPREKIVFTGNPVRETIAHNSINKAAALSHFGLQPDKTTLFIFGGSLGAKTINDALKEGLPTLLEQGVQLLWQTGKISYADAQKAAEGKQNRVKVFEFIKDMDGAYAAADIIISRSGASTIGELCIAGKPAILVPFPYAAEDHQTFNAKALVSRQAAVMVANAEAKEMLIRKIIALMNDKPLQKTLSENIKKMAIIHADDQIAEEILKLV